MSMTPLKHITCLVIVTPILFGAFIYFGWDTACELLTSIYTFITVLIARIKSHVFYISIFVLIVEKVRNHYAEFPENLEPSHHRLEQAETAEAASTSSASCSYQASATRSPNITDDNIDGTEQSSPESRQEIKAAQTSRESAKMNKLKTQIREAFLNIAPSDVLPALVKCGSQALTPADIVHIQEVSCRQGCRVGAADLLERLSRQQGWLPILTRALQDPAVKSEDRQIQMGKQIGQLTRKLELQKEHHKANIKRLQVELEENRQITLQLTAEVDGLQRDQRSQDARLVQLEKEFLSKMKELNKEKSILQSLEGQHQNIHNLLRTVVKEALPAFPTYNEEIQKNIRYIFESLINPDNVLGTFHKYDTRVLAQQDIERVRAITINYGKTRGACELLDILPRYQNWFPCLLKVLQDPQVKQEHVARMMMEKLAQKVQSRETLKPATRPQTTWEKRGSQTKLDKSRFDQQNKTFQNPSALKRHHDKRPHSWHKGIQYANTDQADPSIKRKRLSNEPSSQPKLKTRLDLLLIGKTGSGKSSTGNSILGHNAFVHPPSSSSSNSAVHDKLTIKPEQAWVEIDEYRIRVVDGFTAGNTRLDNIPAKEKARDDVTALMKQYPEGFHSLLLVLRFGEEYSQEEQELVRMLKCVFKQDALEENCVVVFTHGERFDEEYGSQITFKDWLSRQRGPLKSLIDECKGRCVLFRNAANDEEVQRRQMMELLQTFRQVNHRRVGYFLKLGSPQQAQPEQALDLSLNSKTGAGT